MISLFLKLCGKFLNNLDIILIIRLKSYGLIVLQG